MNFSITVDTEVDKSVDWRVSYPRTLQGVYDGIGCLLQPMLDELEVRPVYFLSGEILDDSNLSKFFARIYNSATAELGTHLHFKAAGPLKTGEVDG